MVAGLSLDTEWSREVLQSAAGYRWFLGNALKAAQFAADRHKWRDTERANASVPTISSTCSVTEFLLARIVDDRLFTYGTKLLQANRTVSHFNPIFSALFKAE